jgi:hypothetical protein
MFQPVGDELFANFNLDNLLTIDGDNMIRSQVDDVICVKGFSRHAAKDTPTDMSFATV